MENEEGNEKIPEDEKSVNLG
ncbi:hypothetical protein A2U01_0056154, partial [Trifolium medium]|nr:hypothetical protein [Trifolium medium]